MTDKPITATDIAEKQLIASVALQRLIDEGMKQIDAGTIDYSIFHRDKPADENDEMMAEMERLGLRFRSGHQFRCNSLDFMFGECEPDA